MNKTGLWIIVVLIIIVILVGGVFAYFTFLDPSEEKTTLFSSDGINFIVEDKIILSEAKIILNGEQILMPISLAQKYIDSNMNWDEKNKRLTVTTKDKVIRLKSESLEGSINDEPINLSIPVTVTEDGVYLPIGFLSDFYNIETMYIKENNVFILDYITDYRWIAEPVRDEIFIRTGRSIKAMILGVEKFETDSVIIVYEEYENWYKVRTSKGILGYVHKSDIKVKMEKKNSFRINKSSNLGWKPTKGKINLIWDQLAAGRVNTSKIPSMEGLDVLSPSWFEIQDTKGNILNRVDEVYLKWSKDNNYKIWPLIKNDFNNPQNTDEFLKDSYARENFIRQIVIFATNYEFDGINLDFENINLENKDDYIQLIREMVPMLHKEGILISVDVGVPEGSANWSLSHDRKSIGEIVDYVIVMTYDQYWSTSPTAGSIAQYSWVEEKLIKTLEVVPREKLLLGIPNYIRVWGEKTEDNKIRAYHDDYLTISEAKEYIETNNLELIWDIESGQYYSEFIDINDNSIKKKIWFEDTNSIDLKTSLVLKYNLAGTATWDRSFTDTSIWKVYNNNTKVYENYNQWQEEYERYDFGLTKE